MVEQAQSMEELMRDAEVAEEPGDIRQGSTVASTSNGMTMTASELNSAGYVYIKREILFVWVWVRVRVRNAIF